MTGASILTGPIEMGFSSLIEEPEIVEEPASLNRSSPACRGTVLPFHTSKRKGQPFDKLGANEKN
jgi:hypothetical protein